MKVLKKRDIIKQIEGDLGYSNEIITKVVDSYWEELGQSIRQLRDLNIIVHKIGEFKIVKRKLDFVEEYLEKKMKELGSGDRYDHYETKLFRVRELKKMRDIEYEKREGVRKKRDEYEKNKKSLEIQNENPGSPLV